MLNGSLVETNRGKKNVLIHCHHSYERHLHLQQVIDQVFGCRKE